MATGEQQAYGQWRAMIRQAFEFCGAKGFAGHINEPWREAFANFLSDMGQPPEGAKLTRVDESQGYCPSNCVWST